MVNRWKDLRGKMSPERRAAIDASVQEMIREMRQSSKDSVVGLSARVYTLQGVCAEAYQFAGAVGAPEKVLDNLAAAASGDPIPHESFLPVAVEDCNAFRARPTLSPEGKRKR
jgi:hypothetical protein